MGLWGLVGFVEFDVGFWALGFGGGFWISNSRMENGKTRAKNETGKYG